MDGNSLHNQDNSLADVLTRCWALLVHGARDPVSPLRTPVLATVGLDGAPDARTVVLRRVEPEDRKLFFNTDGRSPKYAQLASRPKAMFVFYDPESGTQLRIAAEVRAHRDDDLARRAWAALTPAERRIYLTRAAPGVIAPGPTTGLPSEERAAETGGYRHFVVLEATATHLDWLHLAADGHRRAAFDWGPDGRMESEWLYP